MTAGSASGSTASASSRMRGTCRLVGRIPSPWRGTVSARTAGPAPAQAGHGNRGVGRTANGVCHCRQMGDSRLEPMVRGRPRPLVGCLPSCARVAYDHATRFAALARLFTAALLASSAARADDPASLRSEAERLRRAEHGHRSQAHAAPPRALRARDPARRAPRPGSRPSEQQARLEDEAGVARRRHLTIARSSARAAERAARERLRPLYVEGEVDPLAVLLGAESLDDALDGARRARPRRRAGRLDHRRRCGERAAELKRSLQALEERQAALDEVVDEAAAAARRARGARGPSAPATSPSSSSQQALNERAIARLDAARQRPPSARRRGDSGGGATADARPAPAPTGPPAAGTRMTVSSTGYCLRDERPPASRSAGASSPSTRPSSRSARA